MVLIATDRPIPPDDHRSGGGGAIHLARNRSVGATHPDCHHRASPCAARPGGAGAVGAGQPQTGGAGSGRDPAGGDGFVVSA